MLSCPKLNKKRTCKFEDMPGCGTHPCPKEIENQRQTDEVRARKSRDFSRFYYRTKLSKKYA
jgi:hypothetical protein